MDAGRCKWICFGDWVGEKVIGECSHTSERTFVPKGLKDSAWGFNPRETSGNASIESSPHKGR